MTTNNIPKCHIKNRMLDQRQHFLKDALFNNDVTANF